MVSHPAGKKKKRKKAFCNTNFSMWIVVIMSFLPLINLHQSQEELQLDGSLFKKKKKKKKS